MSCRRGPKAKLGILTATPFSFAVEMLGEGFKVWDVGAWVWDVTFSFGLRAFGLHSDFRIFGGFGSLSERCQGLRTKGT